MNSTTLEMDPTVNAAFWFVLSFIPHSISRSVIKGQVPFTLWHAILTIFGAIAWQNVQGFSDVAGYWLGVHFTLVATSHFLERVFDDYNSLLKYKNDGINIVITLAVVILYVTFDVVLSFSYAEQYDYNLMLAQGVAAAVMILFAFAFACSSPREL